MGSVINEAKYVRCLWRLAKVVVEGVWVEIDRVCGFVPIATGGWDELD